MRSCLNYRPPVIDSPCFANRPVKGSARNWRQGLRADSGKVKPILDAEISGTPISGAPLTSRRGGLRPFLQESSGPFLAMLVTLLASFCKDEWSC